MEAHTREFDLLAHEALLRSDPRRYAEMVRNITAYGIHLIDREGRLASWNRGAEVITGWHEPEVAGQPFARLFPEPARGEHLPEKTLQFARANRHHRDEQSRLRKNGDTFTALATMDVVRGADGELLGFVEVFSDVTELKRREEALYKRATRDALSGVFNRGHFTELASQEIERARRFSEPLSVMLLDIDHFKNINDTHGHASGDHAIVALARACSEAVRKIDFVGRIGGEEFAIALPRANKEPAMEMAQRLRLQLSTLRIRAGAQEFGFTVSIGVASLRPHTRDLAELLRNADAALYKAKREGRNRVEAWFE